MNHEGTKDPATQEGKGSAENAETSNSMDTGENPSEVEKIAIQHTHYSTLWRLFGVLIIVGVTLLAHLQYPLNGQQYDLAFKFLEKNPDICNDGSWNAFLNIFFHDHVGDNLSTGPTTPLHASYRPLEIISIRLLVAASRSTSVQWKFQILFNIALHALCGILVMHYAHAVEHISWLAGVVAGVLFVLHPMGVGTVHSMGGRGDILAAAFHLFAATAFLSPGMRQHCPLRGLWLALVAGICAAFARDGHVTTLLFLALSEVVVERYKTDNSGPSRAVLIVRIAGVLLAAVAVVVATRSYIGLDMSRFREQASVNGVQQTSGVVRVSICVLLLMYYVLLLFTHSPALPIATDTGTASYFFRYLETLSEKKMTALVPLLLIAVLAMTLLPPLTVLVLRRHRLDGRLRTARQLRRARRILQFMLFIVLPLLPAAHVATPAVFMPSMTTIDERALYLPMAAVALAMVIVAGDHPVLLVFIMALFAEYVMSNQTNVALYASGEGHLLALFKAFPRVQVTSYQLGEFYYQHAKWENAILFFENARRLQGTAISCEPWYYTGVAYANVGKLDKAERNLWVALECTGWIKGNYVASLASVYVKQKRPRQAVRLLLRFLEIFPYEEGAIDVLQTAEEQIASQLT